MRGALVALAGLAVGCGTPCGDANCETFPLRSGEYTALLHVDRGQDGTLAVDDETAVLTYTDADGNVWEVTWDLGPSSIGD